MSYFNPFPVLLGYSVNGESSDVVDMTTRSTFVRQYKDDPNAYVNYQIQDGERPEMIADRFYGDINLYWVIMLFNEIHDIRNDWPLSNQMFDTRIKQKYPNEEYNKIKYYVSISTGAIVDHDENKAWDLHPITIYDYEYAINELKRDIILPIPSEISNIVKYHKTTVGE